MREFVIPAGQKPEQHAPAAAIPVVVLPAETVPTSPKSTGEVPSPERRLRIPPRQRDFIVQYDGRFIGHYRARKPIHSRMAFGQIARELRGKIPAFSAEKLALFRPVKLHMKSPKEAEAAAAGGSFLWFEASR